MSAPRPFAIHVPDAVLTDLRVRLERTRWPDEVPDGRWRYGSESLTRDTKPLSKNRLSGDIPKRHKEP